MCSGILLGKKTRALSKKKKKGAALSSLHLYGNSSEG
jgi:hypothetical protein